MSPPPNLVKGGSPDRSCASEGEGETPSRKQASHTFRKLRICVSKVQTPSRPAYLTNRDVHQHLEGHQVFKNYSGESHLQPNRRTVIYGPGQGPKEDFGKLGGKKGKAQADVNPDSSRGVLSQLEDLMNENCLERGEGCWGTRLLREAPRSHQQADFMKEKSRIHFNGCCRLDKD